MVRVAVCLIYWQYTACCVICPLPVRPSANRPTAPQTAHCAGSPTHPSPCTRARARSAAWSSRTSCFPAAAAWRSAAARAHSVLCAACCTMLRQHGAVCTATGRIPLPLVERTVCLWPARYTDRVRATRCTTLQRC
jgi:hypothetical protein